MGKQKYVVILISFIAGLTMCASTSFAVDEVSCKNSYGTCTVSQTGHSCICKAGPVDAGGSTGSGGGTPEVPPKTEEELQAECKKHLALNCGSDDPIVIPGEVSCENELGSCSVGQNSFSCECAGGVGTGGGGGVSDTGGTGGGPEKTKEELLAECEEMLTDMCGGDVEPPEGSVKCENENGSCVVGPSSHSCLCNNGDTDGAGTTGSGGEPIPFKTKEELMAECKELLEECGEGGSSDTTGEGSDTSSATDGEGTGTSATGEGSTSGQDDSGSTTSASVTGGTDEGDTGDGTSETDGNDPGSAVTGDGDSTGSSGGDSSTDETGADTGESNGSSGGGCIVGGSGHNGWILLLAGLSLLVLWRRKSHSEQL